MADNDQTAAGDSPTLYYVKETRGSQDLITTFNLLPLYNQYVKQKDENNEDLPPLEQTYLPFISDLPGKNVIRPGNYIRALLEAPEKSYGPIDPFPPSTMRDSFSLRPGPVPGFDPSVLGTEEDAFRQPSRNLTGAGGDAIKSAVSSAMSASVPAGASPAHSSHSHHHHHSSHSHSHSHGHHSHGHHSSKSSISSPHVDRGERGEGEGGREHKHKKKKKKRKHEHDHEHSHHDGEGDSEHRKKKKRKREREEHGENGESGENLAA
ncbi:MAG: hypothetical protein J3Q66DRAFT_432998 [Benniella sp.]|nr:MAG: hypothetical protein J3Q66DRAFT_432998 [Benniella sp.]